MLVPRFLFGNARVVKSAVTKAVTALKRGASLQELVEASGFVDVREYPESWIWLDRAWSLRSVGAEDYRAVTFTYALFLGRKVPFERSNVLREESVDYLSRSAWGTVLLNSGQGHIWQTAQPMAPIRPSRRAYIATIAGSLAHWEELKSLGARYYHGGAWAVELGQTLPACGRLLARLGLEMSDGTATPGWRDIRELCGDGELLSRLRSDDAFWNAYVREEQRRFGTPELLPENLEDVARLCSEGSWRAEHWAFLREHSGQLAVDDALARVAEKNDVRRLLGVYIHGLKDLDRASALFDAHRSDPDVQWADTRVARHLKATDPRRAAAGYFESAERALPLGGKRARGLVLDALEEAHEALVAAGLLDEWLQHLERFMAAHARHRTVMTAVRAKYLPAG